MLEFYLTDYNMSNDFIKFIGPFDLDDSASEFAIKYKIPYGCIMSGKVMQFIRLQAKRVLIVDPSIYTK